MIQLTRLNKIPLVVNSDLIKFVEQSPDTVITLVNGDKIVVRESAQDVLDRVVQFRRSVLEGMMLGSQGNGYILPVDAIKNADKKNNDKDDGGKPACDAGNGEGHNSPAAGK
jgi:flagellar protein FlbD